MALSVTTFGDDKTSETNGVGVVEDLQGEERRYGSYGGNRGYGGGYRGYSGGYGGYGGGNRGHGGYRGRRSIDEIEVEDLDDQFTEEHRYGGYGGHRGGYGGHRGGYGGYRGGYGGYRGGYGGGGYGGYRGGYYG